MRLSLAGSTSDGKCQVLVAGCEAVPLVAGDCFLLTPDWRLRLHQT